MTGRSLLSLEVVFQEREPDDQKDNQSERAKGRRYTPVIKAKSAESGEARSPRRNLLPERTPAWRITLLDQSDRPAIQHGKAPRSRVVVEITVGVNADVNMLVVRVLAPVWTPVPRRYFAGANLAVGDYVFDAAVVGCP